MPRRHRAVPSASLDERDLNEVVLESINEVAAGGARAPPARELQDQPQSVATTVPVPGWLGSPAYPGLVFTMTMCTALPEIAEPDLVTELATATAT